MPARCGFESLDGMLSDTELERCDLQMRMPDWGVAGQERLEAAHVFVAGAGRLGSPASTYLVVAGVARTKLGRKT
jgi:adenylyltransferase/sulfurtransferase